MMSSGPTPRDLHELVDLLERRGKPHRYHDRINKDTELLPVYRVQMRGLPDADRKALLFDNVVGNRGESYDISVLPEPRLQEPWHGYLLDYWNDDLQEDADFIVQGEYAKVGEKTEKQQRRAANAAAPNPNE
jgi:3-polyprenyl-4-hydroxybenzoate decarboxylase